VQAKSGDISGTFPTAGNYSFDVLAVDQVGATAVVERLDITVLDRPVFDIAVGSSRVKTGSEFADPSPDTSSSFYVGESYRFSPLELLQATTIVSAGLFDNITFTLVAEDGWFVSAQTGEIFGQFGVVGTHRMQLYAVDLAGKQALVEGMTFLVVTRPVFAVNTTNFDPSLLSFQDVGLELESTEILEPLASIQYAIGSTVKIPQLNVPTSALFVNPAFGDFSKITYRRTFNAANETVNNPGLWLVDTETGEMLAQPERAGNYSVSLMATDGLGEGVVVRNWTFEVLLRDTDVVRYGPNSSDCANKGSRVDDVNIFDRQFECNCLGTGYEGNNCEIKIQPKVCATHAALVDGLCIPFQLAVDRDGARNGEVGAEFTDPSTMHDQYYTVREFASYRIAPLAIDDTLTNYSLGNQSDITYTMVGDTDGFFLNTKTGQMLGTFENFDEDKSATKVYSITLEAVDGSGLHQDLETIQMLVRYPDLQVDEYGPHNKTCQNNGTRMDGVDGSGNRFDQSFVCKCTSIGSTSYSGDNCELFVLPAASSNSGDAGAVAGGLVAAFIVFLLIGYVIYKRKMFAVEMQAFDYIAEIQWLAERGEIDGSYLDADQAKIPREVKRDHVTMTEKIGEGAFGTCDRFQMEFCAQGVLLDLTITGIKPA
jgi:hypothetical protein